ncbi:hypothetical protein CCHR01_01268 [Colletotrichum chrysophilum]|uniref:Uncharacterized protein n=1 Tax=Colletotrichum chrysophilum TaxID=1836956 RepID=A0AAD9B2A3_9PEZI|nr:hypothetical protein CCHR01_01268 [Colletotrichum chrysophilum]
MEEAVANHHQSFRSDVSSFPNLCLVVGCTPIRAKRTSSPPKGNPRSHLKLIKFRNLRPGFIGYEGEKTSSEGHQSAGLLLGSRCSTWQTSPQFEGCCAGDERKVWDRECLTFFVELGQRHWAITSISNWHILIVTCWYLVEYSFARK